MDNVNYVLRLMQDDDVPKNLLQYKLKKVAWIVLSVIVIASLVLRENIFGQPSFI